MTFHHVEMLHLLWILPGLLALWFYAAWRRREAIERFVAAPLLGRIGRAPDPRRRVWKQALLFFGAAAIIVGLARPAWNPIPGTVRREGRDVVLWSMCRAVCLRRIWPRTGSSARSWRSAIVLKGSKAIALRSSRLRGRPP